MLGRHDGLRLPGQTRDADLQSLRRHGFRAGARPALLDLTGPRELINEICTRVVGPPL
jgi:hypothetical protein